MNRRKVVITGLGLATCLGLSVSGNWRRLMNGESGIRRLSHPATDRSLIRAAGALRDEDWRTIEETFRDAAAAGEERMTLLALWAAQEAHRDAAISEGTIEYGRAGVALASEIGVSRLEDVGRWVDPDRTFNLLRFSRELSAVHPESLMRHVSHRPASLIATKYRFSGMNATVTAACASANQAIGIGYRAIQRGDADIMAVGGTATMMNPLGLVFFLLVTAASTSRDEPAAICRPFDRKRSGLVMAEGAAVVMLEEESHALRRNARIYAEVAGYGASLDAFRLTRPHPEGRGAAQSMLAALGDAGLGIDAIDYINAHGTSTKLNDVVETLAIKNVFGERAYRIPVSSSKSMIGHTLAASGAPEFVYTILSVQRDEIHPTINLSQPDQKCDLDYVPNVGRRHIVNAALTNSFGFGGQNATIIVKKYRKEEA
jgi:3-oxoacyl-[acyl-carrier-protein] synthase II